MRKESLWYSIAEHSCIIKKRVGWTCWISTHNSWCGEILQLSDHMEQGGGRTWAGHQGGGIINKRPTLTGSKISGLSETTETQFMAHEPYSSWQLQGSPVDSRNNAANSVCLLAQGPLLIWHWLRMGELSITFWELKFLVLSLTRQ